MQIRGELFTALPAWQNTSKLFYATTWSLLHVSSAHCLCFVLHRFREVVQANEPEVQEVSGLFRSVLLEALDQLKEEQEAQRLARQWNNKRAMSMSLMNFRSRIKINPFGSTVGLTSAVADGAGLSDLKTVSEDVERGVEGEERSQRVWSMPDFRYKGTNSSKVV